MQIPYEPIIFGIPINIHLVLEYLAFIVGFRYYITLRKSGTDTISSENRLSIILGAIVGALVGSRVIGWLEHPLALGQADFIQLANSKTIMGGLFGGLLGVETAKKLIGEQRSSGDLFTLPIIVGIIIGRIGCFLTGINEFTYGKTTTWWTGMDLGDGLLRHPLALYEIVFLIVLFFFLKRILTIDKHPSGLVFKYFMLAYFGFRFLVEFFKPNVFFVLGLSSIQLLCIACWIYYYQTILNLFRNAEP